MKLNRAELSAIAITLLFVCFTAGFLTGRRTVSGAVSVEPVIVSAEASAQPSSAVPTQEAPSAAPSVPAGKLDLNTATAEELASLPGIGEVLAQRIIEHRTKNGAFSSTAELMDVYGIGEAKFEKVKDLITVNQEGTQ